MSVLYIIIAVSALLLITIFLKSHKKTNELEKMKMHVNDEHREEMRIQAEMEKKNKSVLDFKEIGKAYTKAETLHAQGSLSESKKALIHVLSLNPDHPEANVLLASIYLQEGSFSRAEELYMHVVTLDPKKSSYYAPLAKALYGQKKINDAMEAYEVAVKLNPKDKDSHVSLGHIYAELGKDRDAVNSFSKALSLDNKLINLYFLMTDHLININALEEAAACMETLMDLQPYNEDAKEKLRKIRVKKGDNPLNTGASANSSAQYIAPVKKDVAPIVMKKKAIKKSEPVVKEAKPEPKEVKAPAPKPKKAPAKKTETKSKPVKSKPKAKKEEPKKEDNDAGQQSLF